MEQVTGVLWVFQSSVVRQTACIHECSKVHTRCQKGLLSKPFVLLGNLIDEMKVTNCVQD
jgi:hypothetical protein